MQKWPSKISSKRGYLKYTKLIAMFKWRLLILMSF